jgi:para-nitrobenzyl esterase
VAPAEAKAGESRPVIVFIYGGGGTLGSSGMANYGGENMARRGAIFVTSTIASACSAIWRIPN